MNPKDKSKSKLVRKILWKSADGLYAVISGPFPHGLVRSMDSLNLTTAIGRRPENMVARGETTTANRFAKVQTKDIIDSYSENEYGEICP